MDVSNLKQRTWKAGAKFTMQSDGRTRGPELVFHLIRSAFA